MVYASYSCMGFVILILGDSDALLSPACVKASKGLVFPAQVLRLLVTTYCKTIP